MSTFLGLARPVTACVLFSLAACADVDESRATRGARDAGAGSATAVSTGDSGPGSPSSDVGAVASGALADGPSCGVLRARVRDFKTEHPDFEDIVNGRVVPNIVQSMLGPDQKPRVNASVAQANGVTRFEQWYEDLPSVNQAFDTEIRLSGVGDGRFVFDSSAFFPLDGRGFGSEYLGHNFHFSTEIHTRFLYRGGDQLTFSGDDDLWLFINGHLAIDLGGVHAREAATVVLDQRAQELEIVPGGSYGMDIFHAERHTGSSNFRIETTIECIESPILL